MSTYRLMNVDPPWNVLNLELAFGLIALVHSCEHELFEKLSEVKFSSSRTLDTLK